jgi:hypothetical protein
VPKEIHDTKKLSDEGKARLAEVAKATTSTMGL